MWYYVVTPTYSEELDYRRNVSEPYRTWDEAQAYRDRIEGPSEILEFSTGDKDEVIRRLHGIEWIMVEDISEYLEERRGRKRNGRFRP